MTVDSSKPIAIVCKVCGHTNGILSPYEEMPELFRLVCSNAKCKADEEYRKRDIQNALISYRQ